MRAPFQILVIPYKKLKNELLYALFRRTEKSGGYWQGIAGGGEDNETEVEAAIRESYEEANIISNKFIKLNSLCMIPVVNVSGFLWGDDILVIPEYCFGVELDFNQNISLSKEHLEYKWVNYKEAFESLQWDSNRNALWELNHRIENSLL